MTRKAPFRDLENVNITKAGRKIFISTSGEPIIGDQGQLLGYRGVDRDITERKENENKLKKSEEQLLGIFNSARRCLDKGKVS